MKQWVLAIAAVLAWCPVQPALGQEATGPQPAPALDPFMTRLLDSSVVVGLARTYPQVHILNQKVVSGDPVVEQYRGNDALTPSISLWLLPGGELLIGQDKTQPGATFLRLFTIAAGVDYDQFSGRQSLPQFSNGATGSGTIRGDVLFAGIKFLGWFGWRNDFLPVAFGISQGMGFDMMQFKGKLQYEASGTRQTATVDSNGLNFSFTLPFELHLQLGNHVRLRWMFTDTVINSPHTARITQGGSNLGSFEYEHHLSVYTLGYVRPF